MIRLNSRWTDPLRPESVFTGSAYTANVYGVESDIDGYKVTSVTVAITNADGVPLTASARLRNGVWSATFAATCFQSYGYAEKGLAVKITGIDEGGESHTWTRGVGDFEVVPSTPTATPGGGGHYATKGDEVYLRSYVVDGRQHYVKQIMTFDEDMHAWGADWTGDYVLDEDGNFVPANGPDNGGDE